MIIECIGHAEFLIELADGYRIVTDPYDASTGYPVFDLKADAVLVSHGHHDHNAVENVKGWTVKIDRPGTYTQSKDVTVEAIPCFHDNEKGAKRGSNLIFVLKAEGLTVAHLGDLGHLPDAVLAEKVGPVDILMIPVGGFFTIDADTAVDVVRMLKARVVLPMHFRTEVNEGWPIAPVDGFLQAMGTPQAETLRLLRVTKEDLSLQPHVAVMERRKAE
ncbi:MAG: MBL fold metallo-hydrolase [Clostridia bacterium]|nr:MBL fold metallo-hydrolase [Clostridia bacterium]